MLAANMNSLGGKNILLTGASGGLGRYMVESFCAEGANLALTACPGFGLDDLATGARKAGVRAFWKVADIREQADRDDLVRWAEDQLGSIDVLVNNAGVEFTSIYHELTIEQIRDVLRVNLEAPMMLSHALLPAMVARGAGHVVNISSIAGKAGPACQEPYAATKAALIQFTFALRASYRTFGVSASVICPGFVEAGIYSRIKDVAHRAAPPLLAACRPEKVAKAVIRAIKRDSPEIVVSRVPVRPLFAVTSLFPRLGEWLAALTGGHAFFRQVAEAQKSLRIRHVQTDSDTAL